jgi:hypothetical protein
MMDTGVPCSDGFPLEQLVRRSDTRFQTSFAREAARCVPASDDFRLEPSEAGLLVLGRNEEKLSRPVAILREVYGTVIAAGHPRVRYLHGRRVEEPVMHVRIAFAVRDLALVKRELLLRGTCLEEEDIRGHRGVLRGQAALARLLGLPETLNRISSAPVEDWITLSHYAPVDGSAA